MTVVILALPNTWGQSAKARFVVMSSDVFPADETKGKDADKTQQGGGMGREILLRGLFKLQAILQSDATLSIVLG